MIVEVFRELEKGNYSGNVYGVMTIKEEVGLRGASGSITVAKPDVAIVRLATTRPIPGERLTNSKDQTIRRSMAGFFLLDLINKCIFPEKNKAFGKSAVFIDKLGL